MTKICPSEQAAVSQAEPMGGEQLGKRGQIGLGRLQHGALTPVPDRSSARGASDGPVYS